MARREVRKIGDEILRKKSRAVEKIDERIIQILDDLAETMQYEDGVGLAAPQVGILKRLIVVDGGEEKGILKLINPEVIYEEGEQFESEGCLSVPDRSGVVRRPAKVQVKALNTDGKEVIYEGTGLLARALCHEIDHLEGILFIDKVMED